MRCLRTTGLGTNLLTVTDDDDRRASCLNPTNTPKSTNTFSSQSCSETIHAKSIYLFQLLLRTKKLLAPHKHRRIDHETIQACACAALRLRRLHRFNDARSPSVNSRATVRKRLQTKRARAPTHATSAAEGLKPRRSTCTWSGCMANLPVKPNKRTCATSLSSAGLWAVRGFRGSSVTWGRAPPVLELDKRAVEGLHSTRVGGSRYKRPRRSQRVVTRTGLHSDSHILPAYALRSRHIFPRTSLGSWRSRAKSSAPNATAATRGLAEQMEAAFITPRAVSIHGIMHSRWLRLSVPSIAQSSASMQRTSSALCTWDGVSGCEGRCEGLLRQV